MRNSLRSSLLKYPQHEIPKFCLISEWGILWKRSFRIVSGDSLQKLCVSRKFPHQEIRWKYGIQCCGTVFISTINWQDFFFFCFVDNNSQYISSPYNDNQLLKISGNIFLVRQKLSSLYHIFQNKWRIQLKRHLELMIC